MLTHEIKQLMENGDGKEAVLRLTEEIEKIKEELKELKNKICG